MANANSVFTRVLNDLEDKERVALFETANNVTSILAACVIYEGLVKLGESIEKAAERLRVE